MNILILRPDHIGDLFFSTQIFREIKKIYPDSKITLVVSPSAKQIIEHNPYIDEILELDIAQYNLKRVVEYFNMGRKIRKRHFDVGIDLRGSPLGSGMLLWFGGVNTRIGKTDASESKFKQWLMKRFLNVPIFTNHHKSNVHLAKENTFIINDGLGINVIDWTPEIFTTKEDQLIVDNYLDENNIGKFICILPMANGEYKQWPMDRWKSIIKYCYSFGFNILVLGSKKEEDKLNELVNGWEGCRILTGMNLRSLSLLFKDSSMNIGSDSGCLHIAAASGRPTIVLSPSEPEIFKNGKFMPLGESKVIWAKGKDMSSITIDSVKEAIKEWIA